RQGCAGNHSGRRQAGSRKESGQEGSAEEGGQEESACEEVCGQEDGRQEVKQVPRGLKSARDEKFSESTARLKPCPFKAWRRDQSRALLQHGGAIRVVPLYSMVVRS